MRTIVALAAALISWWAVAQTQVTANQGTAGKFGPWPVYLATLPDGGPVSGPLTLTGPIAVVGTDGGPVLAVVTVSGTPTVALSAQALALLAGQSNCTYAAINNPLVDGGTITELPFAPGQTGIMITAHDFGSQVDYVSCWPSATPDGGPFPDCVVGGVGYPIHDRGSLSLDINESHRMRCVACAHGANPAQNAAMLGGSVSACIP